MASGSEILLTQQQHSDLSSIAQSRALPAGYVFRAKLILMLAEGASFNAIKRQLQTTSSPKSQRIKHKLFHGLLAPIRGYTSASQAQFYPRGLFRHSGNVLAFGDRTRINHGVEHR